MFGRSPLDPAQVWERPQIALATRRYVAVRIAGLEILQLSRASALAFELPSAVTRLVVPKTH